MAELKISTEPKSLSEGWRARLENAMVDSKGRDRLLEQIAYENMQVDGLAGGSISTEEAIKIQQGSRRIFGRKDVVYNWVGYNRNCALLDEILDAAEASIASQFVSKCPMQLVIKFDDYLENRYMGLVEGLQTDVPWTRHVLLEKLQKRIEKATDNHYTVECTGIGTIIHTEKEEVAVGLVINFGYKIPYRDIIRINKALGRE